MSRQLSAISFQPLVGRQRGSHERQRRQPTRADG